MLMRSELMRRCQNTRFSLFGMCTSCESQYTILQQKRIPLCLSFRNVHSHTGMMGIDRNDIELYKSVYRDHPLRRRTDISDDGQLWSMSRINRESKKIVQAVDIPLVSDVQRTIPEVHKSEIENREYQYPVHETCNSMKTLATSRRNWILNHVALHLGVITEIGADAIVVGTDRSMTRYQLSSGHVYNQELPSLSNTFKKKKKSVTVEPVGTVRSTEGLINCVAATAILVVQPRRTDEEEYKLCINNVLNEVRENNHRSLLLPILGLSQLDVNRYKAVQWTLEGIKDWMNNGEMKGFISGVETNNQKKNKESLFRIVLLVDYWRDWKLMHDMIKIVLCGNRSPLVPIKPRLWNLPYSIEKQSRNVVRIPTGEKAFKILTNKEKRRKFEGSKKKKKISNGGGRHRDCGNYCPIPHRKIYDMNA